MIDMKERLDEAIAKVRSANPDFSDQAVANAALALVAFDCGHEAGMVYHDLEKARYSFLLSVAEASRGNSDER